VAAIVGVCFAVGVALAVLPGGGENGPSGDAIATEGRVEIRDRTTTTTSTSTTTTSTTVAPTTAAPTTAAPTTAPSDAPAPLPPAPSPAGPSDAPPPPAVTTTAAPTRLVVVYPKDSQGRMVLRSGGNSAVIVRNDGGTAGPYAVVATGAVSVGGQSQGTLGPGSVVTVPVTAGEGGGPGPHGTITVKGAAGVIVEIPVVVTG
jgi:hypothetical protein